MDTALLILRLAVALYLVAGATAKLSNRSGRKAATGAQLATGAVELGAGVLLALGLFTPLAGLLLVAVTANLAFVSWPHEYPLYMLFAAVAIALAGYGGYSLDHAMLGSPVDGPGSHGVAAGFAGALALEGRRRLQRHPWLLAPWSRRQVENVREEPGSAG